MAYNTDKDISEWDQSYSVGIDEIDCQHKRLFELTALFHHEVLEGAHRDTVSGILKQLREYAEQHFANEETFFQDHPESSFHKQIHQAFVLKVRQFEQDYQDWKENLSSDIVVFLRHWLVVHITETDKRFLARDNKLGGPD